MTNPAPTPEPARAEPVGDHAALKAAVDAWDAARCRLNETWHGGRCEPSSEAAKANIAPMMAAAIQAHAAALTPDPDAGLAEVEQLRAKLADAQDYGHKLQKALTGLTLGGSEFFVRHGDSFRADIPACVERITCRHTSLFESLKVELRGRKEDATRIATLEAALALRDRELRDARAAGAGRGEVTAGLKEAVEIADQAYREMTKQTPWDEGMRDMAVRISHQIMARIAAASAPATDETGGGHG